MPGGNRAPSGARGLKLLDVACFKAINASRPFGGAWIETQTHTLLKIRPGHRAPSGARGLKQHKGGYAHNAAQIAPLRGRVD